MSRSLLAATRPKTSPAPEINGAVDSAYIDPAAAGYIGTAIHRRASMVAVG